MEWIRGEYSKLISFVTAKPDDVKTDRPEQENPNGRLQGKEARTFYEDLVINDSNEQLEGQSIADVPRPQKASSRDDRKVSSQSRKRKYETVQKTSSTDVANINSETKNEKLKSDITELDINRFLRFSQEGNIQQVKQLLSKGVDIDSKDGYGWTGLMCASHNGQIEIVKYLLSLGARTDIFDGNNKNVKDIAKRSGNKHISKYIEQWEKGIIQSDSAKETSDTKEQFYCQKCKCSFTDVTVKVHELSMVHLFNSKKRAKDDPFLLPSSNKGYKMMIQSGWDGRKGLGSEGQGQKYPVKTVLKRDRKCLGSEKEEKPKITHFNANETKAIQRNPERKLTKKVLNKRQQRAKERKQKQWERNLRSSMSVDF